MLIKDIVSLDEKAEFRSAVQLSDYDDAQRNIALLRSYLFSTSTAQRGLGQAEHTSSVDLLGELVNAFLSDRADARQVVIADYGHGKSHLALALANYFGRAADSEEARTVLDKLSNALNDPAKAARYRDFKESKGQFLLIRLRGDITESLPAQFVSGLERGLAEHPDTRGTRLPFWYDQAENYLKNLSPEQKAKADAFLAQHDSELPLLLQQIRTHQDVFDLAVETIRAATGIKPDLREMGLAKAIDWAVSTFVGQDKPFGGLLVLFDEFTLYLSRNARRHAAADLQDLLNGIDNHRGLAAFVAFAQVDPDTTADNLTLAGSHRADLKKVLGRLPRKHRLHSLLESVIDAYLMQLKNAWQEFKKPLPISGKISGASETALICFSKRYERTLHWSPTRFQEVITEGCFPLHPITTILLCNMRLETVDTGVPRTVLGFVMEQLKARLQEPALVDGRPNWVLPTTLVDYFDERLVGDAFKSYQNARRTAGVDLTAEQEAVLKALLLYELGEVNVRSGDQFDFLCQASGLDRQPAGDALRGLVAASSIRQDSSSKVYSLWPVTADPQRLERVLREKLKDARFDERAVRDLNKSLDDIPGASFGLQPIGVDWGHSTDWGAREEVITAESFTAADLKERVQATTFGPTGSIQDGARGYVFWALARDDEERDYFRQNAERILDEAFPGESPVPVVVVLPAGPQPGLADNFLRRRALASLNNTERQDIGKELLEYEDRRVMGELVKGITNLRGALERPYDIRRGSNALAVPMAYRAALKLLGETTLNEALRKSYELAYRWRPPTFDERYPVVSKGPNPLRVATARVAGTFFMNASHALATMTKTDKFTRDLCEKQLQKSWGILGPDFRLQKPRAAGLVAAWDLFDRSFKPGKGETRLSPILSELMNPPFGFDYNTAVLLFSAWVGLNKTDVRFSRMGSFGFSVDDSFSEWLGKGAKDFVRIANESAVAVSRQEPDHWEKELRQLLEAYDKKVYSPSEAEKTAANLLSLAADERIGEGLREQAQEANRVLQAQAEDALAYEKAAKEIEKELFSSLKLSRLSGIQRQLSSLKQPVLVTANAPSPKELEESLYAAAEQAAGRDAALNGKLSDIGNYGLHHNNLTEGRKHVINAGYTALADIFDQGLSALDDRKAQLLAEEGEKQTRAALDIMRTDISLAALYKQRDYLAELLAYSDSTIKLRDKKLAAANAEIARLEQEAETLSAGVLEHADQAGLRQAYDRLVSITNRYEDSPLAEKMTDTKTLMDRYGLFLADLGDKARGIAELKDEASVDRLLADLAHLEEVNGTWLGERQRQALAQTRLKVTAQVEKQRAEATAWLSHMMTASRANGNPARLLQQLVTPPAFLSQEQQAQVQHLVSGAKTLLDQDVTAQIEALFRSIRNPAVRHACITRLQQIVGENEIVERRSIER